MGRREDQATESGRGNPLGGVRKARRGKRERETHTQRDPKHKADERREETDGGVQREAGTEKVCRELRWSEGEERGRGWG